MTIDKDMEARILRLHHVEKWGVHTIARQLPVHHTVVERVLSQAGLPAPARGQRHSKRDAYNGFILEILEKYPRLSAQRIYVMACERGYQGASSHFRARVAELRPRKPNEAYLRLQTYPAEQMQMDWREIPTACTKLSSGPARGNVSRKKHHQPNQPVNQSTRSK